MAARALTCPLCGAVAADILGEGRAECPECAARLALDASTGLVKAEGAFTEADTLVVGGDAAEAIRRAREDAAGPPASGESSPAPASDPVVLTPYDEPAAMAPPADQAPPRRPRGRARGAPPARPIRSRFPATR